MKKIICSILALLLSVSLLPTRAFADGEEPTATAFVQTEMKTISSAGQPDDGSSPSADELFAAFAEAQFRSSLPGAQPRRSAKPSTGNLSVPGEMIYSELKTRIIAVATGSESSTQFVIPMSGIEMARRSWTAEELGVAALTVGGEIPDEVVAAVEASIDFGKVLDALLADCPSELFWYDKTAGCSFGGYGVNSDGETIWLTGSYYCYMRIVPEYRLDTYTVDSSAPAALQTAITNAGEIVSRYAAYTDYEKLDGYRKEICNLVEYNFSAPASGVYGNPWQLIWVFDKDPSTDVVCEGYAKAFQYLCDLSSFRTGVYCHSVTGKMDGGSHMWNLVTMGNGKHYVVDVTSCDNTPPDRLMFMRGTDTGSVAEGYTFSHSLFGSLEYRYDNDTLALYGTAELTVAVYDYSTSGETIAVSEDNFPDDVLRAYIAEHFDTDGNGTLKQAELYSVTTLELTGVADLQGIHLFPMLVELSCSDCPLSGAVDLSGLAALKTVSFVDCPEITMIILPPSVHSVSFFGTIAWSPRPVNSWVRENGEWFYYGTDGYPVTGWQKIGGDWYYFNRTGLMSADTFVADSSGVCYVDADGRMVKSKWVKVDDDWYYIDDSGHRKENGWAKDSAGWHYMGSDGRMVTNAWKKDSKGWCYLGSDGTMVTNGWAKDSHGWCWMGADGYMVEQTKWIQVDGSWYYIEKGYRVESKWKKDSHGWCYLGSDGRMVTNGWAPDSKGWCWIGPDGYMVEQTKWIQVDGGWYYIEKGYRVESKWKKDSHGWCYLGSDGRMVTNGWASDSKGWCWIGPDGYMIEETMLVEYNGETYGIRDGYRVVGGSIEIDGVTYSFDENGIMIP